MQVFAISACEERTPEALGRAPIDSFEQHGELRL